MADPKSAYTAILQATDSHARPRLTAQEQKILTLLALEEETRLECSLAEAQAALASKDYSSLTPAELESQLAVAEIEALRARATYVLRNRILTLALTADPVLKAVHAAPSATPGLLLAITDRDILSMLHADLSSKLTAAQARTTAAEREIVGVNAQNQNLARVMVVLAEQLKEESTEAIEDAAMREKLEALDKQLGAARREWRTVKSLVAGIVVGSGVDWAGDPKLLELVIDDEDEIG